MKVYYNRNAFIGDKGGMTETIFCMPFEDLSNWREEPLHNNRFSNIFVNAKNFLEYTSLDSCDFAVLPYKYENTPQTQELVKEANDAGKKIVVLYNDDDDGPIDISPEQGYIFRTSINSKKRQVNEFAFPAFTGDFYEQSKIITDQQEQLTVGFCGQAIIPVRRKTIQKMRKQQILKTDFILRHGFWAPGITKEQARSEFIDNLRNNLFNLCMRGAGNFSYRLYETMMMGRIPIIIDSNQVFPFENKIDYEGCAIVIEESEIDYLEGYIDAWLSINGNSLTELQTHNRQLWEKYLSPLGWLSNFSLELEAKDVALK